MDVTARHPVPVDRGRLARAANNDGATSKEAEGNKESRYPAARCPHKVLALALETCGRHGKTSLKHLRKLARQHANKLEEGADDAVGALVERWGRRLSVALHKANCANLRRSLGAADLKRVQGQELACALAG